MKDFVRRTAFFSCLADQRRAGRCLFENNNLEYPFFVAEQLVDRSQRAACTIDYVTQRRAFVAQSNEQFPGSFDEGSPAAVKSVTFGLIGHFSANLDENGLPDNSVISITSSHMHKS